MNNKSETKNIELLGRNLTRQRNVNSRRLNTGDNVTLNELLVKLTEYVRNYNRPGKLKYAYNSVQEEVRSYLPEEYFDSGNNITIKKENIFEQADDLKAEDVVAFIDIYYSDKDRYSTAERKSHAYLFKVVYGVSVAVKNRKIGAGQGRKCKRNSPIEDNNSKIENFFEYLLNEDALQDNIGIQIIKGSKDGEYLIKDICKAKCTKTLILLVPIELKYKLQCIIDHGFKDKFATIAIAKFLFDFENDIGLRDEYVNRCIEVANQSMKKNNVQIKCNIYSNGEDNSDYVLKYEAIAKALKNIDIAVIESLLNDYLRKEIIITI